MKKAYLFLADGFEESEALVTVDLLRRGGIGVMTVSVSKRAEVTGRSSITVKADALFEDCRFDDADAVIVPGGQPGTTHLKEHQGVADVLRKASADGKLICAICAGPTVPGELGLLRGRKAACYPGCEDGLCGADVRMDQVVCDGNIITSRGVGTVIPFALRIVEELTDRKNSDKVAQGIVYGQKNL